MNLCKNLILTGFFFLNFCVVLKGQNQTPEENRFRKVELASNLDEPMELAVLPEGRVLFIERKGALKLFDPATANVKTLTVLPVFHDLEDGLLGLTLDPDFNVNNFFYLFYSPPGNKEMQRVSRFTLAGDSIDLRSEKVLIEIPTQRKECCHSAGSLAFGPDKTLYIAVGDNTNPHNPGYFNSIDERPGREYWDAQRTAGNTNDLRGKVLRIKPEPDGTYLIPEGNLFPKDGSKGKPEIYAMGCRNPYRVSVDQKTGFLYWGDVGQNTEDNPSRGPISYDEFHQAKKAGFFGWPYFAGDNRPYADFDFATGKIGPFFEVQHPTNDSKNNTGSKELPAPQSAFIWYSYEESKQFENLGTGGKSPIIGPVYYSEMYSASPDKKASNKFPDYFSGKLFIAEWMRDWINVVTMDKEGKPVKIERFMPSEKFDHPIDLDFGPDGALYVLEYGTFWFAQNKNARLVRIEYNEGNRPPVAMIKADKPVGAVPLKVKFSAADSYDNDRGDHLKYAWIYDTAKGIKTEGITSEHTFTKPGNHLVKLQVTDSNNEISTQIIKIEAGNEKPTIDLKLAGNQSFYFPGKPVNYKVSVRDKEDGSLENGKINPAKVMVTLDKLDMGTDLTFVHQNTAKAAQAYFHPGLELINRSDCKACHDKEKKSVGPSFKMISAKYSESPVNIEKLALKIIKGGNGNWGQVPMSAHPQLKKEEAAEMVKYILSIAKEGTVKNRKPVNGSFIPASGTTDSYLFTVAYKDNGAVGTGPQSNRKMFLIRNPKIKAVDCDDYKDVAKFNHQLMKFSSDESYILFKNIDLSNLKRVWYAYASRLSGKFELHTGSPTGPVVSTLNFDKNVFDTKSPVGSDSEKAGKPVSVSINPAIGKHDLYIVYKAADSKQADIWNTVDLDWIRFE